MAQIPVGVIPPFFGAPPNTLTNPGKAYADTTKKLVEADKLINEPQRISQIIKQDKEGSKLGITQKEYPSGLSLNQLIVLKIYNVVIRPANNPTGADLKEIQEVCEYLGITFVVDNLKLASDLSTIAQKIGVLVDKNDENFTAKNIYGIGKARINDIFNKINEVTYLSANIKFEVMKPIKEISQSGYTRILNDAKWCDEVILSLGSYLDLINSDEYKKGGLFSQDLLANISSLSINMGGKNTIVDLSKYFPDMDEILEQKAKEALAAFDFTKRVVKVMFTCAFKKNKDFISDGCIVGWKKINDASGYIVRRRELFSGNDASFKLTNDDLRQVQLQNQYVDEYVKNYVLSFYDKSVDENSICKFVDYNIEKNAYYVYEISAYKDAIEDNEKIFDIQGEKKALSYTDLSSASISYHDKSNIYALASMNVYGNPYYDWILSGINIQRSIDRKDRKEVTRRYSYTAISKGTDIIDFLVQQSIQDNFIIASSLDETDKRIKNHIKKYGAVETFVEILRSTGCLYSFDGIDFVKQDNNFNITPKFSNLISIITAATDTDTVIMDLSVLESNIKSLKSNSNVKENNNTPFSKPTEIIIDNSDITDNKNSEDIVQFKRKIEDNTKYVDLTSIEGIGKAMQKIREYIVKQSIITARGF